MPHATNDSYLGDGLYASYDGYHFVLYTPQGNTVYLDPNVVARFIEYVASTMSKQKERPENG